MAQRTCSVPGCTQRHEARGFCDAHYCRWQKYGNPQSERPLIRKRPRGLSLPEAIAFYTPTDMDTDACWPWSGYIGDKRYGRLMYKGRLLLAHRETWQIANERKLSPAEIVRHSCDNPPCVNPTHLLVGSAADNSRDMVERGRSAFGERSGSAILTTQQVMEARSLRKAGMPYEMLAQRYDVQLTTIWRAVNRNWRHLDVAGEDHAESRLACCASPA
jgi:hypothetical protein